MSALNIIRLRNCAIVVTDAAAYNVNSGVIADFGIKQAAIAPWPGVVATRGAPLATPLYGHLLALKFKTWDEITAGIEAVIPDVHREVKAICGATAGGADESLELAGWSSAHNRPESFSITTEEKSSEDETAEGTAYAIKSEQYKLYASRGLIYSPPISDEALEGSGILDAHAMSAADVLRAMVRLLEVQRRNLFRSQDGSAPPFPGVGGFALCSIVDRLGVRQFVLHRWPQDRVGERIVIPDGEATSTQKRTGGNGKDAPASIIGGINAGRGDIAMRGEPYVAPPTETTAVAIGGPQATPADYTGAPYVPPSDLTGYVGSGGTTEYGPGGYLPSDTLAQLNAGYIGEPAFGPGAYTSYAAEGLPSGMSLGEDIFANAPNVFGDFVGPPEMQGPSAEDFVPDLNINPIDVQPGGELYDKIAGTELPPPMETRGQWTAPLGQVTRDILPDVQEHQFTGLDIRGPIEPRAADVERSILPEIAPSGWSPAEQMQGRGPYEAFPDVATPGWLAAQQQMGLPGEFPEGPLVQGDFEQPSPAPTDEEMIAPMTPREADIAQTAPPGVNEIDVERAADAVNAAEEVAERTPMGRAQDTAYERPPGLFGSKASEAENIKAFDRSAEQMSKAAIARDNISGNILKDYLDKMTDRQKIDVMEGRTSIRDLMSAALGWRVTVAERSGYLGPSQYADIRSKGLAELAAVRQEGDAPTGWGTRDWGALLAAQQGREEMPPIGTGGPRGAEPPWTVTNQPPPAANPETLAPPWTITQYPPSATPNPAAIDPYQGAFPPGVHEIPGGLPPTQAAPPSVSAPTAPPVSPTAPVAIIEGTPVNLLQIAAMLISGSLSYDSGIIDDLGEAQRRLLRRLLEQPAATQMAEGGHVPQYATPGRLEGMTDEEYANTLNEEDPAKAMELFFRSGYHMNPSGWDQWIANLPDYEHVIDERTPLSDPSNLTSARFREEEEVNREADRIRAEREERERREKHSSKR